LAKFFAATSSSSGEAFEQQALGFGNDLQLHRRAGVETAQIHHDRRGELVAEDRRQFLGTPKPAVLAAGSQEGSQGFRTALENRPGTVKFGHKLASIYYPLRLGTINLAIGFDLLCQRIERSGIVGAG
jgi:hypothetical protein